LQERSNYISEKEGIDRADKMRVPRFVPKSIANFLATNASE